MSSSGARITATLTGSLPAGTNNIGVVNTNRNTASLYTRPLSAATSSGQSTGIVTTGYSAIGLDINITAATGTNPTLQFQYNRYGNDGLLYPIWQSPIITTADTVSASIGAELSISQFIGLTNVITWTITGTTPSFTFSISMLGRA
jgi:hypothetical protein